MLIIPFSLLLEERWSRNTSGIQQMMSRNQRLENTQARTEPSFEKALNQAECLSSSLEDSEERESSASSSSSPDFFASQDPSKLTASQSEESTRSTPSAPAARLTLVTSSQSLTTPSRRKPP